MGQTHVIAANHFPMRRVLILAALASTTVCRAVDYERDLQPMLVKKCGSCHSRDAEKVKGDLLFDDPAHLLKRLGKNDLVIPGDWDASYLVVTLFRPEGDKSAMPPKGKGERLTEAEVTLVQNWIAEGAPLLGERGERGPMSDEIPGVPVAPAAPPRGAETWTNVGGVTITATLLRVEEGAAVFRLANGSVAKVPVEQLSEESRARLPKE